MKSKNTAVKAAPVSAKSPAKGKKASKPITKLALSPATLKRNELMDMVLDQNEEITVKDVQRMTLDQLRRAAGIKPEHVGTAIPEPPAPPVKTKADKGKDCGCGCGGRTKGGRYLPGHDAKHHAQTHVSKHAPKLCKCECGEMTKGGTFKPGHDARYYSQMSKVEAA